jgi:outer membrane protein assembly factor BamB
VAQEDWPQFRGPDGLAVATNATLPASLDPASPGLRWKVRVPGTGISSPIVSKGQVFLTTAYEGQELSRTRRYTTLGMLVLGVLALLAIAGQLLRRFAAGPTSGLAKLLSRLDVLAALLATIGFVGIAAVAALDPQQLWARGIPGDTWLVTGTAGLVGLFAAGGWLRLHSIGRLLAGVVLLGVALYLYLGLPLNKHHQVYSIVYRAALVAPGVLGAVWHLLMFSVFRRRASAPGGVLGPSATFAITAMAVLLFVSCNFINPAVGLARSILSLDLATGKQLWDTPLFVAPEERLHRTNTFATPSPCMALDGERILAFFGPGWACVDRNGKALWEGRDDRYMEQSHYGAVSSPIPYKDTFVILHDTERPNLKCSYVMALDAKTGDERWKINPQYAHESYMTPLLMPVGGTMQMITVTFARVVAYDPDSGEKLWDLELPTWQHVPSLAYEGDLLFVSGGAHEKWITAAVRLTGSGKDTKPEIVWQSRRMVPNCASPVYYDGMLFTVTAGGIMVCYDAKTGDQHWKQRLGGSYLASLVAGDGKIYACSDEGDVVVVAARAEFQELSRTSLGEEIHATPAIAQGNVLIRTKNHLYCFGTSE